MTQCKYYWFRKALHRYFFAFIFLGGQEEYVLSYEPVNQQEGL